MVLTATSYQIDHVSVIRLTGALTTTSLSALEATLGELEPTLARLLRLHTEALVIDLSAVTVCDRFGLGILSTIGRAATRAGVPPRLAAASREVRTQVYRSGLRGEIPMFATTGGAIRGDPQDLVPG
jgi:anti-anti-sigma regulatory factor